MSWDYIDTMYKGYAGALNALNSASNALSSAHLINKTLQTDNIASKMLKLLDEEEKKRLARLTTINAIASNIFNNKLKKDLAEQKLALAREQFNYQKYLNERKLNLAEQQFEYNKNLNNQKLNLEKEKIDIAKQKLANDAKNDLLKAQQEVSKTILDRYDKQIKDINDLISKIPDEKYGLPNPKKQKYINLLDKLIRKRSQISNKLFGVDIYNIPEIDYSNNNSINTFDEILNDSRKLEYILKNNKKASDAIFAYKIKPALEKGVNVNSPIISNFINAYFNSGYSDKDMFNLINSLNLPQDRKKKIIDDINNLITKNVSKYAYISNDGNVTIPEGVGTFAGSIASRTLNNINNIDLDKTEDVYYTLNENSPIGEFFIGLFGKSNRDLAKQNLTRIKKDDLDYVSNFGVPLNYVAINALNRLKDEYKPILYFTGLRSRISPQKSILDKDNVTITQINGEIKKIPLQDFVTNDFIKIGKDKNLATRLVKAFKENKLTDKDRRLAVSNIIIAAKKLNELLDTYKDIDDSEELANINTNIILYDLKTKKPVAVNLTLKQLTDLASLILPSSL